MIKFHPLWTFSKIRFQYENVRNERTTIGVLGSLHYAWFKGIQIGPQLRYYFGKHDAPKGAYLQLQAQVFSMQCTHTFFVNYANYQDEFTQTKRASGYGAGFGIGKQWLLGNHENIVIDLMFGLKYHRIPANAFFFSHTDKNGVYHEDDSPRNVWYVLGPGSIFNNHLGIGILF
ncbi:MAG: DUF3575 domain-containing protein [Cytophagales bacterium]